MGAVVKHISKTAADAEQLAAAHRWLINRVDITQDEWCELMMQYGLRFAAIFSLLFPAKEQWVEDYLTKEKALPGEPNNWFWMWFRLKWMQDDAVYMQQAVYKQPISYEHYKTYMLHSEALETELMNMLFDKVNF